MADTTARGYPYPEGDDVWRASADDDGGAPWKNLAEAVDADVTAVEAAASGSTAGVAVDLADHEAATTSVHGIANTANLVTTARQITAGTGLTGGGTLAADRSIGIAAGGVGTTQLADDAVTSAKIADGTIATGDIANGAVTDAKLAGSITPSKVTGTAVVQARQVIAGTGLTGGGDLSADRTISIAAGGVGTTQLADDAVTTGKIAAGAVGTTDIADSAVTSAKIADGTIVDADINTSAAIAPTKISGTAVVQARTITGVNSLTGGGDLSTNRTLDVADGGIGTTELATGAVTETKIADGSVTLAKLSGTSGLVASATVGNLLPAAIADGSATTGLTATVCTVATTTAASFQGTNSLLITASAGTPYISLGATNLASGSNAQAIPVTSGGTYTLAYVVLLAAGTARNNRGLVNWFDSGGALISSNAVIAPETTTASWVRRGGTLAAPANAALASVHVGMTSATSGDAIYVDNLTFHRGAGGEWVPPGVPVPGLGTRANPADSSQVQVWNPGNSTWITV